MAKDNILNQLEMLRKVIFVLLPDRRTVSFHDLGIEVTDRKLREVELEPAVAALEDARSDQLVDAQVVDALLVAMKDLARSNPDVEALSGKLVAHVERRWAELAAPLSERAVNSRHRAHIVAAFPQLRCESALISHKVAAVADARTSDWDIKKLVADLPPETMNESRLLIAALDERRRGGAKDTSGLAKPLFASIGRAMHWTPWAALQAVLRAWPEYSNPQAIFEQECDQNRLSSEEDQERLEVARAIEPFTKVREVSAVLLQLLDTSAGWRDDSLLSRPAEVRAAYVETLCAAIDGDAEIRQAAIEALLWLAGDRTADLAQFAAVALAEPADRAWMIELERHPVQIVRYAARAVRAAKFGEPLSVTALPVAGSLSQSLAAIEGSSAASDEAARTWLGDRAVEQLIERTISSVESRFAREYEPHGNEGEDNLLSSLFTTLALRFEDLDVALEALARASSAPHRASVTMLYRKVDRSEEGKAGIKGAKSFSADLCLIVDPILNGISMGRRVTLIQAKRLYRDKNAATQPTWNTSFKINLDQRRDLQKQTQSSVYFFHGPLLGGRGVPVIPTQLVADLSEHQGSGTQLARTMVAVASRSLADWLTYDALALRVGDPYAELVKKAGGSPGSLPRALLDIPRVEVEVALSPRSEGR